MVDMINAVLMKRYRSDERADIIREAFPDVNVEAICRAILGYRGNFPPYPKDIEVKVYQLDIDGVFMSAIRNMNNISKEEHLSKVRQYLREDLR